MVSPTVRRVVVSGLGVITSTGECVPAFQQALFSGACGIGAVDLFDTAGFPCRHAGQVKHRDLRSLFNPREIKRASRCDLLGLAAAREAFADAGLAPGTYDGANAAIVLGAGTGGLHSWERYCRRVRSGAAAPCPSQLLGVPQCTITDRIASHYSIGGHRATIATACSSSATSIGYGFDLIRSGACDIVITGGSESLSECTFAGFSSLRLMDARACRPFDKNRQGLSLGEGAAILILEEYEHARKRGIAAYAEVLGYAINCEAFHMTSPHPDAGGMSAVMSGALERAGITADHVDYINAHGTGTPVNDTTETLAIKKVFGEQLAAAIPISSTKSMVGHCLGASGAIEAAATVLAILRQAVPPTVHYEVPDPACDLDYVPNHARQHPIRTALSNSFAFGGNNTSLVFGRVDRASARTAQ